MMNRDPLPRAAELEQLATEAGFTPEQFISACLYVVERDVSFDKTVRDRLRAKLDRADGLSTTAK